MSNFAAFDNHYLESLIEPFLPGASPHITPIKYEALTPDMFAFLFRTTAQDQTDHFFVALEYDYLDSLQEAEKTIQSWHGSFLQLMTPEATKAADDLESYQVQISQAYYGLLAKVESPVPPNYWSDAVTVAPEDVLNDTLLAEFPSEHREQVRKGLEAIRAKTLDAFISVYIDGNGLANFYYR